MNDKFEHKQDNYYLISEYERRKQLLYFKAMTPDEYDKQIRKIVRELKI